MFYNLPQNFETKYEPPLGKYQMIQLIFLEQKCLLSQYRKTYAHFDPVLEKEIVSSFNKSEQNQTLQSYKFCFKN